jgi:hypothetical protein
MIPKSEYRFPACAKPWLPVAVPFDASAGEGRSEKIMLKYKTKLLTAISFQPLSRGRRGAIGDLRPVERFRR